MTEEQHKADLDALFHAVQRHGLSHEWEAYKVIEAALSSPHPYYGPCDALKPDGGCAECAKSSPAVHIPPGFDEALDYINNGRLSYRKLSDITSSAKDLSDYDNEWYPVNEILMARIFDFCRGFKSRCTPVALPKMQKVDFQSDKKELGEYNEDHIWNDGYNQAIDDIKTKYGELYAGVK